jgi:hypothetical protein
MSPLRRQGLRERTLAQLVVICLLLQLVVIGYVFYSSYQGRVDVVNAQQRGCARNKLDRSDNAAFQQAQATYITKVTAAKSVHEDVKRAAREAVVTFNRTSAGLTKRAGIDCLKAFPKASLFP